MSKLKTNKSNKDESKHIHDLDQLRIEIAKLSYEQALNKLDFLLDELKNESLLVEDLKRSFLKASLYLEHCENLLTKIEQEVIEINWDDLSAN